MVALLKTLGRGVVALVLVLLAAGIIGAVVAVARLSGYEQEDDQRHLREKVAYLREIGGLPRPARRPNIVFVLYDDLGYGDLSVTGSRAIRTPHIDALAREGVRFSRFYSPAPICTPARFGFLTGRFAERGGLPHVVFPQGHPIDYLLRLRGRNIRIPAHEITLADILRAAGYRTGMVGKWHLGDHSPSLPNDMGFESFFGALYSNDMQPFALYRNKAVVESAPADQARMSQRYADAATDFIAQNTSEPFFLYLAHNFPHIPLHVRDSRLGTSPAGLYGDVVEELDDGIGQLVAALKTAGVYDNTLIIVSSDNGPWFQGSAGPVRGRKGETFEGGMRVPFVVHWPGTVRGGRVENGLAMGTDLLPTLLDVLALPPPGDRLLDGKSLLPMLSGEAGSPHEYLYYFSGGLKALRNERFKFMPRRKLIYATADAGLGFGFAKGPWLFDLELDANESYDASAAHGDSLRRLRRAYESAAEEFRANPEGWR